MKKSDLIILVAIFLLCAFIMSGCVSLKKYNHMRHLLSEARVNYRSCMKVVKNYEGTACLASHPEPDMGRVDFGTAGH